MGGQMSYSERSATPLIYWRTLMRKTSRRGLLSTAPIVPLGWLAAQAGAAASATAEPDWVRKARAEIPASTTAANFQTGGIGPSPVSVLDEVARNLHRENRGPADTRFRLERVEPDLRVRLARTFGADPSEVALTHSTTEGICIAAWSVDWRRGDEVVISNQEHPANVFPWYQIRDRFGVTIREINLDAGTDLLKEVEGALRPSTRMVSLSHVSRNNGRRIVTAESAKLAALLRRREVRYLLDGAQGPGCVPVNFAELGADYYAACGHKWLLGPKGTGALFVRKAMLDRTLISWAGSHSTESMDYVGNFKLLPSAARFEFGTRALAEFSGFDAALRWIERLGWERVHGRIAELVEFAIGRARATGRLTLVSPENEPERSGVFVVKLPNGADAMKLYQRLGAEKRILGSPVRRDGDFRLAIHFFNTRSEIATAIEAIDAGSRAG